MKKSSIATTLCLILCNKDFNHNTHLSLDLPLIARSQCGSKQYLTKLGTCENCDVSCLICDGPAANECLSCETSRMLLNGECIENTTSKLRDDLEG